MVRHQLLAEGQIGLMSADSPAPDPAAPVGRRGGEDEDAEQEAEEALAAIVEAECSSGAAPMCCGVPRFLIRTLAMTTLTSILLGYDIGIWGGAKLPIQKRFDLSSGQIEVLVGMLNFISAFAGLASGRISDSFGRRKAIIGACLLFIVGSFFKCAAQSYASLMAGRVITGLGVGTGMAIAPLFSAELAPKRIRGALVSFVEVAINLGILLGYVLGWALSDLPEDTSWRWMLGVGAVPPVIIAVGMLWTPESPRWLVAHGRSAEAALVLARAVGRDEALEALAVLRKRRDEPKLSLGTCASGDSAARALLVAGLGTALLQQATGIEAQVYYTPEILASAGMGAYTPTTVALYPGAGCNGAPASTLPVVPGGGDCVDATAALGGWISVDCAVLRLYRAETALACENAAAVADSGVPFEPGLCAAAPDGTEFLVDSCEIDPGSAETLQGQMIVGAVKLLFILVATYGLDRKGGRLDFLGRKPLLIISALLMTVAQVLLGVNFEIGSSVGLALFSQCLYMAAFSLGYGPICWVYTAECFPLAYRGSAMGLATFLNRITSGIIAMTFLSMVEGMGQAGPFWLFAAFGIVAVAFTHFYVIETKNRSLEEIERSAAETVGDRRPGGIRHGDSGVAQFSNPAFDAEV